MWVDNDNKLGYRPDSIEVELYANGQPTGQTLKLKPGMLQGIFNLLSGGDSGWSGVFKAQPKYDNAGTLIEYTVVETSNLPHYQISYGKEQDGTQVITNTARGNLTVAKNVTGSGDTKEEFHFVVTLSDVTINGDYGDMTFRDGVARFALCHGESKTATYLPEGITYTVSEEEANQGAYITTASQETGTIQPGDTAQAVFVNDLSNISFSVVKTWEDNNNQSGVRPDKVTVELLADGVETGKTLVLSEENSWKGSFDNLNQFKDGQKIVYTVKENVVEGYETTISGNMENGFSIINTYIPDPSGPVTGDFAQSGYAGNMLLWTALLFISSGVLGTAVYKKKK